MEVSAAGGMSVDQYLATRYDKIKGMSSTVSAKIVTSLLQHQTASGIHGSLVELGVYEGRFFIAMALCAGSEEKSIGVDTFSVTEDQLDNFHRNCRDAGLSGSSIEAKKADTFDLGHREFRDLVGNARFVHVDANHSYDAASHDLVLSTHVLMKDGIICLDDVLHPYYPELTVAAADFLKIHLEFVVFAVIDRESLSKGCKYLICHTSKLDFYQSHLKATFVGQFRRSTRAKFARSKALILIPVVQSADTAVTA